MNSSDCLFCRIARRDAAAAIVHEDEVCTAFLDHRPLFVGHCLLAPRRHCDTLYDLPADVVGPFFAMAQRLARAVETGLGAQGTFLAINNKISQSVPHLHVHVVPRRAKDGLRGFFWPREKYESAAQMEEVRAAIADALRRAAP